MYIVDIKLSFRLLFQNLYVFSIDDIIDEVSLSYPGNLIVHSSKYLLCGWYVNKWYFGNFDRRFNFRPTDKFTMAVYSDDFCFQCAALTYVKDTVAAGFLYFRSVSCILRNTSKANHSGGVTWSTCCRTQVGIFESIAMLISHVYCFMFIV